MVQFDERFSLNFEVAAAGGVVFTPDGKILLVEQRKESLRGLWHLPMGTVEPGELLEDAARREIREETGIEVRLLGFLGSFPARLSLEREVFILRHVWAAVPMTESALGSMSTLVPEEILRIDAFSIDEIRSMWLERRLRMHATMLGAEAGWEFWKARHASLY